MFPLRTCRLGDFARSPCSPVGAFSRRTRGLCVHALGVTAVKNVCGHRQALGIAKLRLTSVACCFGSGSVECFCWHLQWACMRGSRFVPPQLISLTVLVCLFVCFFAGFSRMAKLVIARRLTWVPEAAKIKEVDSDMLGEYVYQVNLMDLRVCTYVAFCRALPSRPFGAQRGHSRGTLRWRCRPIREHRARDDSALSQATVATKY